MQIRMRGSRFLGDSLPISPLGDRNQPQHFGVAMINPHLDTVGNIVELGLWFLTLIGSGLLVWLTVF